MRIKAFLKYHFLIAIILLSFRAHCQIVNMESDRIVNDTTGWAGTIKAGLSLAKDVATTNQFIGETHIQYKNKKSLYLIRANVNYTRAGGETFVSNNFLHLRHNYKLNTWLRWEEFTQFQQNKITGIDLRYLLGTGPRFKLFQVKTMNMYIGTAIMYEYEVEKTDGNKQIIHENPRSSNYISFTYHPNENVKISHTSYYQTLFDFPKDHRISSQTDIEFKISKKLVYTLSYRILYDTSPALGIPTTTYGLESYIGWSF